MPVFDTPITTDENSLPKVLKQTLPIILYLYNRPDPKLDTTLNEVARENAGKLLIARVDASQNPQVHAQYQRPTLPAIIALKNGETQSTSAPAQPADVKAQAAFLLGQRPKPKPAPETRATDGQPVTVSDSTFTRDVLQSKTPVLVDFWAPWCGPCHMVAPILEQIAQKYAGRLKVAKLNVDENPQSASQYQAHSIPMLVLFKDGRQFNKLVGAHPQPNIERLVESALS